MLAHELEILNRSETPPFHHDEQTNEELRLKYRYLDLRREEMQQNILLRHKVTMAMRSYLDANGFIDVETPMLTRTIENIMEKTGRTREEAEAPILSTNPQGRFIKPEEVAATVLWLCSAGAASVNGQAIELSGGGN